MTGFAAHGSHIAVRSKLRAALITPALSLLESPALTQSGAENAGFGALQTAFQTTAATSVTGIVQMFCHATGFDDFVDPAKSTTLSGSMSHIY